MAVLQKTYDSINPYESIRNKYANNAFFDEARWNRAARTGNLALEQAILSNSDKLGDYDSFISKNRLDSVAEDEYDNMFYFAATHELFDDKTEIKEYGGDLFGNTDSLSWNGILQYINSLDTTYLKNLYSTNHYNIGTDTIEYAIDTLNNYSSYEDFYNDYNFGNNKNGTILVTAMSLLADLGISNYTNTLNQNVNLYTPKESMTEYEYNERILQDWINYDNQLLEAARKKAEYENKSFWEKLSKTLGDIWASFAEGVTNVLDAIGGLISGTGEAINASINGKDAEKAFRDAVSSSNVQRTQDFITELEIDDGSFLRDEYGNYTTVGQWVSGAATTIGEMFAAWALGGQTAFVTTGGAATSASVQLGKISLTTGNLGYGTYYTAAWVNRMGQRFNDPAYDSTPTWQIMLETGLQTVTDIVIEKSLGYLFGSSVTDKIIGASNKLSSVARKIAGGISKLPKAVQVAAKVGMNIGHEILEENIQDMVAVGVNQLMGVITGNFGTDDITWQSILDTTMITAFTSALMVSANIVATPRVTIGINPETEAKIKLGKLTSWLYSDKLNDLLDTYDKALNSANLSEIERARVIQNMQFAATNLVQLFNGLGTERLTQAIKLMNQIDAYQKSHELNQMLTAAELKESGILTEEEYYSLPAEYRNENNLVYTQSREEALENYVDSIVDQVSHLKNELAIELITKKNLKKKTEDKLGKESQQSVAEDLNDADISTLHSIVTGDKDSDVPDKNKSEKQIEVAQDVLKHTKKKAVVLTDGNNVVESDEAIFVPSNYAETVENSSEVVQSVAEQGLIKSLTNSLDKKILDKLVNFYKSTISDKRKATQKNAIRALLFDQNFLNTITPFFTKDLYTFAANIKAVLEASAGKNLQDAMYRKVIEGVIGRFRVSLREYLVNIQYADMSQAVELFTKDELDDIRRKRWSFDIANTLTEYGYDMLTTAQKAIVDNNINYLPETQEIKDKIREYVNSSSKYSRERGINILNSHYTNLYYASYNDKVYFKPTTPARSYFNQFMKASNFSLIDVALGHYNSKFTERYKNAVDIDNNPYTDPADYIKDRFSLFTNGNYEVQIRGSRVFVQPTQTNEITDVYSEGITETYLGGQTRSIDEFVDEETGMMTVPLETKELVNKALSSIVDGSKISNVNLAYLDIDTIIQDATSYLKPSIMEDIEKRYGDTSSYSVYLYLKDYMLDNYETLSITRDAQGNYRLIGLKYAYEVLNPKLKNEPKDSYSILKKYARKGRQKLSEFIDKDMITPEMEDVEVEIKKSRSAKRDTHGGYDAKARTITLYTNENNAEVKFAILHEYQHLLDKVNNLAQGGDPNAFSVSKEMVADFEKHLPGLFTDKMSLEQKRRIIRRVIYENLEGELRANRMSTIIEFVPMFITQELDGSYTLTTSWGAEYKDVTNRDRDSDVEYHDKIVEFMANRKDETSDVTDELDEDKPKKKRVSNAKKGTPKRASSDRIYVSKEKYGNTNAKAFVGRNMPKDVLNFITEANKSKLPSELWSKIENGTLNYYDIHEYFRKTHDIDDYTFDLIKRNFWPNSPFRNNKELVEFTQLKLRYFYALSVALQKAGMDIDLHEPKTFEQIMTIYQQLSANSELAAKLDKASVHYDDIAIHTKDGTEYIPLNTDENHLRVSAMQYYDGTIDSAAHVAAISRAIAMSYKYSEAWNTADVKKGVSLDQSTKGHKADDDSSGTYADIISNDIRYARDTIDQALTEQYESNTRNQNIELLAQYYGDKLRKRYTDYGSWTDAKKRAAAAKIIKQIHEMSDIEFETMVKKVMAKQLGANYTQNGIENKDVGKPRNKRKNLIAQIKNRASQVKNLKSSTQWKNVPEDYKKYFDDEGNLKQEYYANVETSPDRYGNFPKLRELFVNLNALAQGLKNGDFVTRKGTAAFLQAQRYKSLYQKQKTGNQKLKAKLALVDGSNRLIVSSQTKEFKLNADIEIPKALRTILDTQYDYEAETKQQFITDPDEKHAAYSTKKFFEVNAENLNRLTSSDVEEIIRFYSTAIIMDGTETSLKKFEVTKIYLAAYFIEQFREGRIDIDSYYVEQAQELLKSVRLAASLVSSWRNVMYRVNPNKVIIETISRRLGIELSEEDAETLANAGKTGDVKKIASAHREVSRKLLYEYKSIGDTPTKRKGAVNKTLKALGLKEGVSDTTIDNIIRNPEQTLSEQTIADIKKRYGSLNQRSVLNYVQDIAASQTNEVAIVKRNGKYIFVDFNNNRGGYVDKLLTWQKAMMLSSPATAIRNQISNIMLQQGNKLADIVGKLALKGVKKIANLFGKDTFTKTYSVEQLNLADIKLSEHKDVVDFVQKELVDSGLMNLIEDVASKYDTRSTKKKTGTEAITDMIVQKLISDITRGNTYNHDIMNKVVQTIFSWQSDTRFINKTAKEYIAKLLIASNVDITKGLTDDVMNQIAEGYKLAAFDYMHKGNIFSKLENTFRERNPKAFLAYKLLLPFVPSSWNWFVEGVNWTPIGLVKSIVQLCRLEQQITKIDEARRRGDNTIDPRLVQYTLQRNLGKGIIGSFFTGLGMTLGALGIIVVDSDDDKLKIKIGDVYFDISNIFGSSSLLIGAALMQPSSGSITTALESAFGQFMEDSVFNDIAQMFSYNRSLLDIITEMPTDLLGTFIPNFLKTVNKLFYSFELDYSDGFIGNLQYLLSSSIPFLAYAFPKKIDPFTGEVQSKYGLPFIWDFLTDFVNVASPVKVKPHKVSNAEFEAISVGLNKKELSGDYDDIGQVDATKLNQKYGELNKKELTKLMNNQQKYTIQMDDASYKDMYYSQMTDEQKATVIDRIMSNNSRYAKIYVWTQSGGRYYTNASEIQTLKKLGIYGVYIQTKRYKGFVKDGIVLAS